MPCVDLLYYNEVHPCLLNFPGKYLHILPSNRCLQMWPLKSDPLSESVTQIKGNQDLSEAPCGTLLILPFRMDVVPHSRSVCFLFLPLILYLLPCLLLDSCELCLKQEPIMQNLTKAFWNANSHNICIGTLNTAGTTSDGNFGK